MCRITQKKYGHTVFTNKTRPNVIQILDQQRPKERG